MKKPGLEKCVSRDSSMNHFDAQTPDGSSVSFLKHIFKDVFNWILTSSFQYFLDKLSYNKKPEIRKILLV